MMNPGGCLVSWKSANDKSDESGLEDDVGNSTDDVAGIQVDTSNALDNNDPNNPMDTDAVKQYGISFTSSEDIAVVCSKLSTLLISPPERLYLTFSSSATCNNLS